MISIRKSDSEHTENPIPGSSPTVLASNTLSRGWSVFPATSSFSFPVLILLLPNRSVSL